MIAITTSSSISVKPRRRRRSREIVIGIGSSRGTDVSRDSVRSDERGGSRSIGRVSATARRSAIAAVGSRSNGGRSFGSALTVAVRLGRRPRRCTWREGQSSRLDRPRLARRVRTSGSIRTLYSPVGGARRRSPVLRLNVPSGSIVAGRGRRSAFGRRRRPGRPVSGLPSASSDLPLDRVDGRRPADRTRRSRRAPARQASEGQRQPRRRESIESSRRSSSDRLGRVAVSDGAGSPRRPRRSTVARSRRRSVADATDRSRRRRHADRVRS